MKQKMKIFAALLVLGAVFATGCLVGQVGGGNGASDDVSMSGSASTSGSASDGVDTSENTLGSAEKGDDSADDDSSEDNSTDDNSSSESAGTIYETVSEATSKKILEKYEGVYTEFDADDASPLPYYRVLSDGTLTEYEFYDESEGDVYYDSYNLFFFKSGEYTFCVDDQYADNPDDAYSSYVFYSTDEGNVIIEHTPNYTHYYILTPGVSQSQLELRMLSAEGRNDES